MAEVVHDEKLLMHFFQDSLSGATLSWYMRLDNTKIRRWKDLVDAFVKQYKYKIDIAPDRTSLSNLEKRDKESIREYAQRWRESVAQVHPPLLDKEMVSLFANTLKAPYYEHVMGSSAQQFTDAVVVCECIEQGVKSGRISAPTEKKVSREKRSTMLKMATGVGTTHPKTTTLHPRLATSKKPKPHNFQTKSQIGNYQSVQEQLPLLPLPLNEMYQKLLSIGHIAPECLSPV